MKAEVAMRRRRFECEFKIEAVRLIKERGVSVVQASRDLATDPVQAFPGHGQMKPEQPVIERLRREVVKLKAEREPEGPRSGIRKRPQPTSDERDMRFAFVARHCSIWLTTWLPNAIRVD
jgi:transposase